MTDRDTVYCGGTAQTQELLALSRRLLVIYTHEGVGIWWEAGNRNLNGFRPSALWLSGERGRERVRDEIDRLVGEPS